MVKHNILDCIVLVTEDLISDWMSAFCIQLHFSSLENTWSCKTSSSLWFTFVNKHDVTLSKLSAKQTEYDRVGMCDLCGIYYNWWSKMTTVLHQSQKVRITRRVTISTSGPWFSTFNFIICEKYRINDRCLHLTADIQNGHHINVSFFP